MASPISVATANEIKHMMRYGNHFFLLIGAAMIPDNEPRLTTKIAINIPIQAKFNNF